MEERKCFACGGFGHMAHSCRKVGEEEPIQVSSNRSEVLKVRVMQKGEGSSKEVTKDRREVLREEKAKRGVEVRQTKVERKVLWDALDINNFYFILFYFSILLFFFFCFFFFLKSDEEARDNEVT